jgi:hypothetical protein
MGKCLRLFPLSDGGENRVSKKIYGDKPCRAENNQRLLPNPGKRDFRNASSQKAPALHIRFKKGAHQRK